MSTRIEWPPRGTTPLPIDVVSVQSQVVYGRVGNNVAVPVLSAFGLTVAAVPTVVLSNTPHYASMHGGASDPAWFRGWLDDLSARGGLASLRAVQAGYLGSAAQARLLAAWIRERLSAMPGLQVLIDPVIGDHAEGVYVDPKLVDAYRGELLSLADGLTPNDFELAHLAGRTIASAEDAVAAARGLLRGRTRWIAVTSAAPGTWPAGRMQLVLATRERAWRISHPRIAGEPKGTGDLFTAGLVACLLRGVALPVAAARASQRVIDALRLTQRTHCAELLLPDLARTDDGCPDVVVEELALPPRIDVDAPTVS